ncbi:manganese efflux pump [Rubripirellula amarantea]|nr:manganese efflux pump [Rubripirellula amarantea]
MSWYMMLLISVGLSADAFAISVVKGATSNAMSWRLMLGLALAFGLISIAFFGTGFLMNHAISTWSLGVVQDGVSVAMLVIGLQMIVGVGMLEANSGGVQVQVDSMSAFRIVLLMLAANLDVLAISAVLPCRQNLIANGLILAATTTTASVMGFYLGSRANDLAEQPSQLLGGMVLVTVGCTRFFG